MSKGNSKTTYKYSPYTAPIRKSLEVGEADMGRVSYD